MRFEQLEYLIDISKHGSISAAAKKLHMSHQALSISIKTLEEELGVTLLARTNKGVTLTAEGKEALVAAEEFLQKMDNISQKFKIANPQGTLTIAATTLALECLLPKSVASYRLAYPQVTVSTLQLSPTDTLQRFNEMEVDLAFSTSTALTEKDMLESWPHITFHPCITFTVGVIISQQSPLAAKKSLTLSSLKNQTIIYNCSQGLASDPSHSDLFQTIPCKQKIYEPHKGIYKELIKNNAGIGITSLFQGENLGMTPSDTIYLPIRDIPQRFIGYFVHDQRAFSPLAQLFIKNIEGSCYII